MKDKIKKYYNDNKRMIETYTIGFIAGGVAVAILKTNRNDITEILGWWANDEKTMINLDIIQQSGQRKRWHFNINQLP